MHKFLFYNKFIKCLYMFRALLAHHQEVKMVLYSIRYHHTETSEWSKITKIQFCKYEHIVVEVIYEFFGCNYCIFLHYNHVKKYTVITPEEYIYNFYYYVLIFTELYFSNF
jgi:hypothetical protein